MLRMKKMRMRSGNCNIKMAAVLGLWIAFLFEKGDDHRIFTTEAGSV
jgi:hypothetical protein